MNSGVYKISFGAGKYYIGSAIKLKSRNSAHKNTLKRGVSNCLKLQRAYNKYGKDLYQFEVIEFCSVDDLRIREKYWIDTLNSVHDGYNLAFDTTVPMLGRKHSEATKLLMSRNSKRLKTNLGVKFSAAHRKAISKANKGKKGHVKSSKEIEDIKARMKGVNNSFYGKKHSQKTLDLISSANKGKNVKPIIVNGVEYPSANIAAEKLDLKSTRLRSLANGAKKSRNINVKYK